MTFHVCKNFLLRLAHYFVRFPWALVYPGDTQLWCKWYGFRQTIKRIGDSKRKEEGIIKEQE